jgi:hypothetical protein
LERNAKCTAIHRRARISHRLSYRSTLGSRVIKKKKRGRKIDLDAQLDHLVEKHEEEVRAREVKQTDGQVTLISPVARLSSGCRSVRVVHLGQPTCHAISGQLSFGVCVTNPSRLVLKTDLDAELDQLVEKHEEEVGAKYNKRMDRLRSSAQFSDYPQVVVLGVWNEPVEAGAKQSPYETSW